MDRDTILLPADCELRRLPLDAIEAFVLSQVDGRLTLEEIGEVVGLDFVKTAQLAKRLVELGAVKSSKKKHSLRPRVDPRAEKVSLRPKADPRAEKVSLRPKADPRAEKVSLRPAPAPAPRKDTNRAPSEAPKERRRRTTRSLRAVSPPPSTTPPPSPSTTPPSKAARAEDETCDLDEATFARIVALDAKLKSLDHYAVLEVERSAEKRDIKRAYFAMAATFHPDRFFTKKLGGARAPLDRIFIRLTEAHDTLSARARREEYDATLSAPAPSAGRSSKAPAMVRPSKAPPPKTPSRRMSKQMKAAARATRPPAWEPIAIVVPPPSAPASEDKFRRLQAAAKLIASQNRAEVFLRGAEEALRAEDIIGAANNYRLALQCAEDPFVRLKYEAVEGLARTLRHEKSLARARAAERSERWADAAEHFARANEARPEAAVAERAAYALRMSGGDLKIAATLAEQAVERDGKNAGHHVTLGEIYLAEGLVVRAKSEVDLALDLAPDDPRGRELAAAIRKKK